MLLHSKLKQFLPLLFIFALVSGCETQPVKEEIPTAQIDTARQLFDAGDYTAAAEEFLKLSHQAENITSETEDVDSPSMLKEDYLVSATEAYVKAGDSLNARKTIVIVNRHDLDEPLMLRYDIAQAGIAELDQQPEQVINALRDVGIADTIPGAQKEIFQLRIAAFETLESNIEAARSRAQIDPLLEPDLDQDENRRAIWTIVDQLDADSLTQLQNGSSTQSSQDPLIAWVELSMIAKESLFDAEDFNKKIDQWRLAYPDHPAETPILAELFEKNESLGKKVSSIALLLPQEGRFAQAGAAVRDGFISAWYGENDQTDQPMVHVYHADVDNIIEAYENAVEDGADLIIGPLEKNALKTLLTLPELPVRTLALNQLSDEELSQSMTHVESDHLYQFGLSPEQEAGQVAEKAWAEGYSHALAITPEGAWGARLFNAFKEKYEELGGVILEHQQFGKDEEKATIDFSGSVMQLLNIDGSKQRFDALTEELRRKIKFEPRPRQDMDFIFMAAPPVQARQIRPQLLFHRASRIPVITTSHAFGLPPRGEPDLDLEGVIIGDMPWMIRHQEIDPETPLSMQQNWPDDNAAFLRLFALGMDAYKIIPQLGRLRLQVGGKFEGETGNLFMNENAQVQRDLVWAKFSRGKPQFLDPLLTQPVLSQPEDEPASESERSPDQ